MILEIYSGILVREFYLARVYTTDKVLNQKIGRSHSGPNHIHGSIESIIQGKNLYLRLMVA